MPLNIRKAFIKAFKEFCNESVSPSLKNSVNPKKTKFESLLWGSSHIALIVCAYFMAYTTFSAIFKNPLIVSLESTNHPIGKIPFPAVSICDINRISKQRINDLVTNILFHNLTHENETEFIRRHIVTLGNLLDYELEDEDILNNVQTILEKYMKVVNITLPNLMQNLSTPCEELLYQCIWKSKIENCSDLFTMSSTYEGFCCTFNYIIHTHKKKEYLNKSGLEKGLTVIIKNNPDDYYYPMLPSVGVNVHIFHPGNFPDIQSGHLIENIASIGTETFIALNADSYYAVEEVRKYSPETRICLFNNEMRTIFGNYSISHCLVTCRIKSIATLCQCVPFIFQSLVKNTHVCFLNDLHCLHKYQEKWQSFKPFSGINNEYTFNEEGLEFEQENSLQCICIPECVGTRYHVSSFSAPLHKNQKSDINENFSVVRVYFDSPYANLYVLDVVFYWYEIISNFGGIFGLFIGISIISTIELFYYLIIRFIYYLVSSK